MSSAKLDFAGLFFLSVVNARDYTLQHHELCYESIEGSTVGIRGIGGRIMRNKKDWFRLVVSMAALFSLLVFYVVAYFHNRDLSTRQTLANIDSAMNCIDKGNEYMQYGDYSNAIVQFEKALTFYENWDIAKYNIDVARTRQEMADSGKYPHLPGLSIKRPSESKNEGESEKQSR